jgi:hypothetical protein
MLPPLSFVDRRNGDAAIHLTTDEDMLRLAAPVNHETDLRMKNEKIKIN